MVAPSESLLRQQELYGAAIGDVLDRITGALGLSQAAVARTIGVSAPMLSQLASGRRTTIGNPLAVQRLRALVGLAEEVGTGLAHSEVSRRLDEIRQQDSTTFTGASPRPAVEPTTAELLRTVASGRTWRVPRTCWPPTTRRSPSSSACTASGRPRTCAPTSMG